MLNAIVGIPYQRGTTNTAAAIQNMRNNMFTSGNGERTDASK